MTENEKAATFIGWKRGDFRYETWPWDAPDMSRPENYMRAVGKLLEVGRTVCFTPKYGVIIHDDHGLNLAEGKDCRAALAALYDAE
jgi:hypothetical protein